MGAGGSKKRGFGELRDSICLCCDKKFKTTNPIGNRICPDCSRSNKDIRCLKRHKFVVKE